jgi:hypothetical protein
VEHLFDYLITTYYKLNKLGIAEINGKIVFINKMKKNMNTSLHNEKTFYGTFLRDLEQCKNKVIIESPFITSRRIKTYWPIFRRLYNKY